MRSEFGCAIDAHPGGIGPEAGTINRAFQMATGVILNQAGSLDDGPSVLAWVLKEVALARLHETEVIGHRAEGLLDLEPKLGNEWLAYLALAPASVIDDLLEHMTDG